MIDMVFPGGKTEFVLGFVPRIMSSRRVVSAVKTLSWDGSAIVGIYDIFQEGRLWYNYVKRYFLPKDINELACDMSDLSLTHNIVGVDVQPYGLGICVMESKNGKSNIDDMVVGKLVECYGRVA